jgi:hypothetical protein
MASQDHARTTTRNHEENPTLTFTCTSPRALCSSSLLFSFPPSLLPLPTNPSAILYTTTTTTRRANHSSIPNRSPPFITSQHIPPSTGLSQTRTPPQRGTTLPYVRPIRDPISSPPSSSPPRASLTHRRTDWRSVGRSLSRTNGHLLTDFIIPFPPFPPPLFLNLSVWAFVDFVVVVLVDDDGDLVKAM